MVHGTIPSCTCAITGHARSYTEYNAGHEAFNQQSNSCGDIHFTGLIDYVENRRISRSEEFVENESKSVKFICADQNYVGIGYENHALVYRISDLVDFELIHKTSRTEILKMALSIKNGWRFIHL